MATRAIKGILVRNDWQFYESACAIATCNAAMVAPQAYLVFTNNGKLGEFIDLYRVETTTSIACAVQYVPCSSFTGLGGSIATNRQIYPLNILPGQPIGQLDAFSNGTFTGNTGLHRRLDSPQFDVMEMANGGPFLSLPANYSLVILVTVSGASQATIVVWYQVMQDQIVPAQ